MRREWACFERVFSPEECAGIVQLGLGLERKLGTVGLHRSSVNRNIRHSEVAFIKRNDLQFVETYAVLDYLVEEANEEWFGVRYFRHGARQLQFTVYDGDGDDQGFYGPHEDGGLTSGNGMTQRKLSVMVQLSDPDTYTGGEFRMHHTASTPPAEAIARQGSLVVFPSIKGAPHPRHRRGRGGRGPSATRKGSARTARDRPQGRRLASLRPQRSFVPPLSIEPGGIGRLGGAQTPAGVRPAAHTAMQHDATCLSTREASAFPGRSSRTLDRYRVICEGPTFSKFASHVWYSKADAGLFDEEREPARLDSYDSIVEHFTERPDLFVRVTDDSLDRAGYRAGDIVAARRASDARAGDLVVARAGARVTLRRLAAAVPSTSSCGPRARTPSTSPCSSTRGAPTSRSSPSSSAPLSRRGARAPKARRDRKGAAASPTQFRGAPPRPASAPEAASRESAASQTPSRSCVK